VAMKQPPRLLSSLSISVGVELPEGAGSGPSPVTALTSPEKSLSFREVSYAVRAK